MSAHPEYRIPLVRHGLPLATLLVIVAALAAPAIGQIGGEVKINASEGDFAGTLDDSDRFGFSIAPLGDLNNDGEEDLAVGAFKDDDGGIDTGAVWILFMDPDGSVGFSQKISSTSGGLSSPLTDGDWFGWSVENLGDLDGDGVTDIAVGAVGDDFGGLSAGSVFILFLNTDGTVKAEAKIGDSLGGFGGQLGDFVLFGSALANLGDLDNDGVIDLAVGSAGDMDGGSYRGAVYILFMNADGTVKADQKISDAEGNFFGGLVDGDEFGWSAAPLGDLNGDGNEDVAVGALLDDDGCCGDQGAVWILFLNSDGTVNSFQKISATQGGFTGPLDDKDQLARGLANVGDLDGDGNADLGIGAYKDDDGGVEDGGAVYLVNLNSDGTVKAETKISTTSGGFLGLLQPGDGFGSAVALIGDLDGDGEVEFAVGAPNDDDDGMSFDTGAIWVLFSGGTPWMNLGLALEGTNGFPGLEPEGTLIDNDPVSFTLSNAAGSVNATLIVGISAINAPFKGGTLIPSFDFTTPFALTSPTGDLVLAGNWPAGFPSGFTIWTQYWIVDPGGIFGFASSNGIKGTTP